MLDSEIEKLTIQLCSCLDLPEEAFEKALYAAYRGEDMEPLWKQRRLKKEEIIVGVYNVPTEKGGTTIVFKTEDGCFWQLCDMGLGWTFYDQIESDWKSIDSLIDLLPTRINPRPKIEKPWHFEISFNPNVTLVIRPDKSCNNFKWGIRKNT